MAYISLQNMEENISMENFIKALSFIKTNPQEEINIIGPEALTNFDIKDFIKVLNADPKILKYTLHTNFLILNGIIDVLNNKKNNLFINLSVFSDIKTPENTKAKNDLLNFRKKAGKIKQIKYEITINKTNNNIQGVIDVLKELNSKTLYISLNKKDFMNNNSENMDILSIYRQYKEVLFPIFGELYLNNIMPIFTCNKLPECILSHEERKFLKLIKEKCIKNSLPFNLMYKNFSCNVQINIFPDLTASRCLGFTDFFKISLSEFSNIQSLRNYFTYKIDAIASNIYSSNACKTCQLSKQTDCNNGCIAYKKEKLREMYKKII